MKNFTTDEIRGLLNQVYREEISFSQMVGIMNKRVSEVNESQYKDGDFVVNVQGSIIIFKNKVGDSIYDHVYFSELTGVVISNIPTHAPIKRYATMEEKQKILEELVKEGNRWNAEKLCIENIQDHKFMIGDKVRIKHGVSSKTHDSIRPYFAYSMDKLIGKELTVEYCDISEIVICDGYAFLKEWLEPYEELKKGDLAIFWDKVKKHAIIAIYERLDEDETCLRHKDTGGSGWENAIKFESKKQFERLIKGKL